MAASKEERRGTAGIDNMTVKDFERREIELLELIRNKLKTGYVSFQAGTKIPDTEGGFQQDAEVRNSCSNGLNS